MARLQKPRLLWAAGLVIAGTLAADGQEVRPETSGSPPTPSAEDAPPRDSGPSAKAPAVKPSETPAAQSIVGLHVFSSDGTRVGEVQAVEADPAGTVVSLRVRTGGFLGFGGRIIAIPGDKFIRSGHSIRLDLDSDGVNELPALKP